MKSRTIFMDEEPAKSLTHMGLSVVFVRQLQGVGTMSIDVEIYQQAQKVIEEESYKHVNVERLGDDLLITVHQLFGADETMEPVDLMKLAGFTEVDRAGDLPRGRMIWQHSPKDAWQVTAMYMHPRNISLSIEWPVRTRQNPKEFRGGLQALNRVFNAFRTKMESTCDQG